MGWLSITAPTRPKARAITPRISIRPARRASTCPGRHHLVQGPDQKSLSGCTIGVPTGAGGCRASCGLRPSRPEAPLRTPDPVLWTAATDDVPGVAGRPGGHRRPDDDARCSDGSVRSVLEPPDDPVRPYREPIVASTEELTALADLRLNADVTGLSVIRSRFAFSVLIVRRAADRGASEYGGRS